MDRAVVEDTQGTLEVQKEHLTWPGVREVFLEEASTRQEGCSERPQRLRGSSVKH